MSATPKGLQGAIAGDLSAFVIVQRTANSELLACAASLRGLAVTRSAVARSVAAFSLGEIPPEQAELWASFVTCGFVAGTETRPLRELEIGHDSAGRDIIAEVVVRLESIGDAVLGEVTPEELQSFLCRLAEA